MCFFAWIDLCEFENEKEDGLKYEKAQCWQYIYLNPETKDTEKHKTFYNKLSKRQRKVLFHLLRNSHRKKVFKQRKTSSTTSNNSIVRGNKESNGIQQSFVYIL